MPSSSLPEAFRKPQRWQALPDTLVTAFACAECPLAPHLPWQLFTEHRDSSA